MFSEFEFVLKNLLLCFADMGHRTSQPYSFYFRVRFLFVIHLSSYLRDDQTSRTNISCVYAPTDTHNYKITRIKKLNALITT